MEKIFGKNLTMGNYEIICNDLLQILEENRFEIFGILSNIETYKTANDEIERCLLLLKNIRIQKKYLGRKYDEVLSSFLPLNQPLYSLFLQVIVPSLILQKIYYRPPSLQIELHQALFKIFEKVCANIKICTLSRKLFMEKYVTQNGIVNFTGKYENAVKMISHLPKNISVIYNGSAVNPVIIDKEADLALATADLIYARLYNSGQDCMAPACAFVEISVLNPVLKLLKDKLSDLKIGTNKELDTDIGPLISKEAFNEYIDFKKKYSEYLIYGGNVDEDIRLVEPAIFCFDTVRKDIQEIYFAPYFVIMAYSDLKEIKEYLDTDYCEKYAGYISLYGKRILDLSWFSRSIKMIPLDNTTLFWHENGNKEFGGYGIGCSFVYTKEGFKSKPLLLLREIAEIMDAKV